MVQIKIVKGPVPDYAKGVNPVLTLNEHEQSYTIYVGKKDSNGEFVKPSLAERIDTFQRLGRTCRQSPFTEFELPEEFCLRATLAFAQGFYDPRFDNRDAKSFTVPSAVRADFERINGHMTFLRDLINEHAESLTPEKLAEKAVARIKESAASVGKQDAVKVNITHFDQLIEHGFVGVHTVGRGSANKPCLVEVDFNPTGKVDEPVVVALVGKGITFDTGGYSLKPSDSMSTMRSDMGGAALMASTLALAIASGLDKRVKLFLSCAENMVSSNAFRLGDIITYPNGVTVSVDNTDAEGRVVLADSLILASSSNNGQRPKLIIDAATLTGAAKVAVGTDYHSLLSFDTAVVNQLLEVAEANAELFWRLPLAEFHREQIRSPFATISNTGSVVQSAGASTAASFLSYFVTDYQKGWLHIDASSTFNRRGGPNLAFGATGKGLQTLAKFLVEYK
ncbi:aminopeptidase PepB [Psittacicella melopsittaci]|uniref:Aminopeptidase PepB n=1 Tax=Psittacicella melopsittaci TaxID=2028576 RepID=A0A3A1Y2A5_9GAMM|nr:aminopeptidase PepB [Psittacicella melopsittaci]RIY31439.1 aminopeptidase PepB [Psittacicella melopsittaci]